MNKIFRAAAIIAALMSANVGAESSALARPRAQPPDGLTQPAGRGSALTQLTDKQMSKVTAGRGCDDPDNGRRTQNTQPTRNEERNSNGALMTRQGRFDGYVFTQTRSEPHKLDIGAPDYRR